MKLVEQIHNLDWKQPPKCMDTKKLKNVVKSVEVFKGFYDSLPPQCKSKVITKNAKMCVDVITEKLKKHSDAMKASIIRAVNNFFGSSQGCIEEARKKFEHLDQYVLRGCQN
nr:unnamed protein product [Callosobruchus chinensis]